MLQNKIQNFPINLAIFPFHIQFSYFGETLPKKRPLIGGRGTAMLIECKTNALLEVGRFHAF
jgi:hypothetical protein